jgi:hypothetical protein
MLPIVSGLSKIALNLQGVYILNFYKLSSKQEIFKYLFIVKNLTQNSIQERVFKNFIKIYFIVLLE